MRSVTCGAMPGDQPASLVAFFESPGDTKGLPSALGGLTGPWHSAGVASVRDLDLQSGFCPYFRFVMI